jgi:hypothetical protein
LDNIDESLESPSLAAALTSEKWNGREPGKSKTVDMPIKCLWLANGNRVQFHEDIMRRSVPIGIDAQSSNPALNRTAAVFKYKQNDWLKANHVRLAWACCNLVQNWIYQGKKPWSETDKIMGSYEAWCSTIGGILEAASIPGFLGNRENFLLRRTDDADPVQLMFQKLYDDILSMEYQPYARPLKRDDMLDCWYNSDENEFFYPFDNGRAPKDRADANVKLGRKIATWTDTPKSITVQGGKSIDVHLVKEGSGPNTEYFLKPVKDHHETP